MAGKLKVNSLMLGRDSLPINNLNDLCALTNSRTFNQSQLDHLLSTDYMRETLNLSDDSFFISHSEYMDKLRDPSVIVYQDCATCENRLTFCQLEEFVRELAWRCPSYSAGKFQIYYSTSIFRNSDEPKSKITLSITYFEYVDSAVNNIDDLLWKDELTWQ